MHTNGLPLRNTRWASRALLAIMAAGIGGFTVGAEAAKAGAPGPARVAAAALAPASAAGHAKAPIRPQAATQAAQRYFVIKVLDDRTGRGIPLVELRTVHQLRFVTDSNGVVAFDEPGLMNQRVFFFVESHGYESPKDGFGMAGVSLQVTPGGRAEIKLRRVNLAERLYRITGAGIYRDSVLVGEPVPIAQPLLNGQVLGQDSVMAMPYRGRIYWFWGDTNRPAHPLGLFHTSGATSRLPGQGGLSPAVGVDLEYFVDAQGFSRAMCPSEGPGPVWIDGLALVDDAQGNPRMVTHYSRMKNLSEVLEHGLAVYDDQAEVFRKHRRFELEQKWQCPRGHSLVLKDSTGRWLLFATPFPTVRVRPRLEQVADPAAYEAFTCLASRARFEQAKTRLHRDAAGKVQYRWTAEAPPLAPADELALVRAGLLASDEARFLPKDVATGKPVVMHSGSVAWNAYRQKWILIAVQAGGDTSFLGEVWFSEADHPTGPWRWACKVVTHNKYSFYNPAHHPFFDEDGGRIIYFEGTYTHTFSGNSQATPRYDYNQIMYRLDLSDPRLPKPLAGRAGPPHPHAR